MSSDAAQQGLLQWLLRRIKVILDVISVLHVFSVSVDYIYFHMHANAPWYHIDCNWNVYCNHGMMGHIVVNIIMEWTMVCHMYHGLMVIRITMFGFKLHWKTPTNTLNRKETTQFTIWYFIKDNVINF